MVREQPDAVDENADDGAALFLPSETLEMV